MVKRKVIIHKHLFKNAGSTFDWILEKNFKSAFCDHRDDSQMIDGAGDYLIRYLEEHDEIKALSGHNIWFTIPEYQNIELIPVVFLRHPIERIRSVYNFEYLQQSDSLGARMAKQMTFTEYVTWRMRDDIPDTIRNFQTRMLAGLKQGCKPASQHLQFALHELDRYKFTGLVDQFTKSMQYFKPMFLKLGFDIDLNFIPQNVMQPFEDADYEARAATVLDELGPLAKMVIEKNRMDIALYQAAKNKLYSKVNPNNYNIV